MEARPGTGTDSDPGSGEESHGETWPKAWPEPESDSGSRAQSPRTTQWPQLRAVSSFVADIST